MSTTIWEIFIPIHPQPKAYRAARGRLRLSDAARTYQNEVERYLSKFKPAVPLDGYLSFEVTFYLERKEGQKNRIYPHTKPDMDNLLKSIFDAMERAHIFENDSRFVDGIVKKRFAGGYDAEGICQPGASVKLFEIQSLPASG